MATYAIGDIQGCFSALKLLLETIHFDPQQDEIWLVGDLVNRGRESAAVLRWAMSLGDKLVTVLGNHDLHLLAVAAGHEKPRRGDTLDEILAAPDREAMLDWLRHQHMIYAAQGWLLVHAGLLPQWTVAQAIALGHEVELALRADNYRDFLGQMYGNQPDHWEEGYTGIERLRVITNAMTRLRVCKLDGSMDFDFKAEPSARPQDTLPWYDMPQRRSQDANIVFGHWSALGLNVGGRHVALDTGCLWGGQLSALRLQDKQVFQVPCAAQADLARWR